MNAQIAGHDGGRAGIVERPKGPRDTGAMPRRLGGYRIDASLGRGSMGEVLLAWDRRLERHVAIKRIRTDLGPDAERRARFRREARAVARLNHASVVQVFDVFDSDGGECLVMERVEGEKLSGLIGRGEVDLDTALKLAAEIAEGLGEAHAKGVLHRDLKPANVIVTPAGHAKIVDFGLARALWHGEDSELTDMGTLTEPGTLVGTLPNMSPEQASGRRVDHRSDLFALGVLLYEMLTGRQPFRGDNLLDTLRRLTSEEPVGVDTWNPAVPAAVVELIERLLAKDPARRPPSARLVAAELEELRSGVRPVRHPAGSSPTPGGEGGDLSDLPTLCGVKSPGRRSADLRRTAGRALLGSLDRLLRSWRLLLSATAACL